jgi:hypothetical protein
MFRSCHRKLHIFTEFVAMQMLNNLNSTGTALRQPEEPNTRTYLKSKVEFQFRI